jgi:hypothetical protein
MFRLPLDDVNPRDVCHIDDIVVVCSLVPVLMAYGIARVDGHLPLYNPKAVVSMLVQYMTDDFHRALNPLCNVCRTACCEQVWPDKVKDGFNEGELMVYVNASCCLKWGHSSDGEGNRGYQL